MPAHSLLSTPPSPKVENFQMKIYYPAGDQTLDPLNQRQTCYHLSQRGEENESEVEEKDDIPIVCKVINHINKVISWMEKQSELNSIHLPLHPRIKQYAERKCSVSQKTCKNRTTIGSENISC